VFGRAARGFAISFAVMLSWATASFAKGCEPIIAAQIKGLGVPTHSSLTLTKAGVKIFTVQNVWANGRSYAQQSDGSWKVVAIASNEASIRKDWSGKDCSQQGEDVINGDPTNVFYNLEGGTETRIWISRSTGLIVRWNLSDGNVAILHTFDYDNVEVPTVK
jgi:hypothetical protein